MIRFLPLLLLAGCMAPEPPPKFKAEQVVTLSPSAFGCRSLYDVRDVLEHQSRGEYSAAAAIANGPFCFSGADPSLQRRVFQVDGPLVKVGFSGFDQYEAVRELHNVDFNAQYWVVERYVIAAE